MQQTTLIWLFNDQNQIALCMKKRGFGQGKYNGPGGKLQNGETAEQCILRELEEETGVILTVDDLVYRGFINYYFDDKPQWDQSVYIFKAHYNGTLEETDEMKPYWIDVLAIPYDHMREPDRHWLPRIIDSQDFIEYDIFFDKDSKFKKLKKIK